MKIWRKVVGLLVLAFSALAPVAAWATPITYDFTLTPTTLGSPTPIFGISSLPAGPFIASLTLSTALPPSLAPTNEFANVTAFSVTIGTQSWSLGDVLGSNIVLGTDASGLPDHAFFVARTGSSQFELLFNAASNVGWVAVSSGQCFLSPLPLIVTGPCIAGDPSSVQVSVPSVPEPATLALLGLGLAGLGFARRKRRDASIGGR